MLNIDERQMFHFIIQLIICIFASILAVNYLSQKPKEYDLTDIKKYISKQDSAIMMLLIEKDKKLDSIIKKIDKNVEKQLSIINQKKQKHEQEIKNIDKLSKDSIYSFIRSHFRSSYKPE